MKIKNLKQAVFAREYGASELMLASMTGHYPPPHTEMDQFKNKATTDQSK